MEDDRGVVTAAEPAPPPGMAPRGVEVRRIDAPAPHDRPSDPTLDQRAAHRLARRLGQAGRPVEPPQPTPHERLEHARAIVSSVLREVRVIGRNERNVAAHCVAAPREPDGSLGGDVHEIGAEIVEVASDGPELWEREADGWVRGERR